MNTIIFLEQMQPIELLAYSNCFTP